MYACSKFFLRHSNEALVFSITVGKFFFNRCVPIGPCVPTGTFTPIVQALGKELRPVQLGVSTRGGCQAAAHAARRYARDCRHRRVLLKIDMRNAFNSLRRDSFLSVARVRTPGLYSLLWQAYSSPTRLFFGEEGGVCFGDGHSAGRPNWTRTLCSIR